MRFNPSTIPKEMREKEQWVLYVKEKNPEKAHIRKQMISVTGNHWHKAKSTEPNDWATFDAAYKAFQKSRYDGMVFCLKEGIVFIDIDNSIDEDGNINDLGKKLLHAFPDTYAERSCSGKGIHIFLKGKLPTNSMKRNDAIGLEIYDTKRFACMTGDIISQTSELAGYQDKLNEVAKKYLRSRATIPKESVRIPLVMDDEEILRRALRSRAGPKIARLFQGDISGYPSQSNADIAFMDYMAFWTRDPDQLDSLMRSSGLYREKWDEPRGDSTYGRITIEQALAHMTKSYSGRKKESYQME